MWLLLPAAGAAHRLDEYLQATRVGIGRDRIDLEIDLTPGVSVADVVFGWIDRDHDGAISSEEADAYSKTVIGAITLDVDDRRQAIQLATRQFPTRQAMVEGVGAIRFTATAHAPDSSPGRHYLVVRNMHQPGMSVYLANALVPADRGITVTGQRRDVQQHELRVEYTIADTAAPWLHWRRLVAAALLASVIATVIYRTSAGRKKTTSGVVLPR